MAIDLDLEFLVFLIDTFYMFFALCCRLFPNGLYSIPRCIFTEILHLVKWSNGKWSVACSLFLNTCGFPFCNSKTKPQSFGEWCLPEMDGWLQQNFNNLISGLVHFFKFWYVCVSGMWCCTSRCCWFWQQFQAKRVQNYFCAKEENWQQYIFIYPEDHTQIKIVQYTPVS